MKHWVEQVIANGWAQVLRAIRTLRSEGPGQIQFWLIALVLGTAAGAAAVGFREAIFQLQTLLYGANDRVLHSHVAELDWWRVMVLPIGGGAVVGVILWLFTPDGRSRSVANVIEGAALREGRVETKAGIASAIASLITLSTGGSSGREGPVVHLAALISSWVSNLMHSNAIHARDLMGCAVAAAVSASFNAPIAGALFALEVVLRHFAVHAFAPIIVASVSGTVVSRLLLGDNPEFPLPEETLAFYVELPAFMILGLLSGLVALVLIRSIFFAEDVADRVQERTHMPVVLRPALAGALLGGIAVFFPHIIGVGYETTFNALAGQHVLQDAIIFAVVKVVAVAITFAGRMGGGVFSPALMVGALTGLAFGHIATGLVPSFSGTEALYALAGTGAVAAAVLGAPISTTLIVFELTGDWQAGIAVMVSVSLATALCSRLVDRSFFLTQLERRGIHMAGGPQDYLPATIRVARLMRPRGADNSASDTQSWELVRQGAFLTREQTLETALPRLKQTGLAMLPVVALDAEGEPAELLGALFEIDAIKAYNRALIDTAREEHS